MHVLVGDIGGTHTRIARVAVGGSDARIAAMEVFSSREHDTLEEILDRFTGGTSADVEAACFGVAGPVRHGAARTTNLPWRVESRRLEASLGVPVALVNDLEATAWSVPLLGADDVELLHDGQVDPSGNGAVIAPGTGLGHAGLFRHGGELQPFPSEGGHADFAPSDDLERQLQAHLARRHGHVSWERVVSGPGLIAVHEFLATQSPEDAGCGVEAVAEDDRPAAITRAAGAGECRICVETVRRFSRLLGAQAGNLALIVMATGGVWIAGGIAPDIVDQLRQGAFEQGFLDKGRMRYVVEPIPVWVVLDELAPLRGAARRALREVEKL